ncbi:MAG: acyl-CoA dehydrogenase family protein [Candidatus Rokubacteria bacterium]|nr:acyl-CoA dehydrogenase family protein [Candidatus Rokubacteria bacterium]
MNFDLTPEQQLIQRTARELAEREFRTDALDWTRRDAFPWDRARTLARAGLLGLTIPEADGGQGGKLLDAVLALEQVAQVCPRSGDVVHAGNFGAIRILAGWGTAAQKATFLPALLAGEALMAVGLTEPEAGSAATDLRTSARIEGDRVVINGQKVFTTNGPHATLFLVYVRFGPGVRGIGAVLVPRDTPGFRRGEPAHFMSGERWTPLYFEECAVPVELIVVPAGGFGRLIMTFNIERLGNATRSLALGQAAFDYAVGYAAERRQFGRPLAEFQGIQWKFAEMKMKLEAARLLLYRAATHADRGAPSALDTALAKAYANTAGFEVANECLQVLGGYGYSAEYPLEYLMRRTRGWMIAGGTVEILKNRIAEEIFHQRFPQRPSD